MADSKNEPPVFREMSKDNPPAFPRSYVADGHNGMSLRDWFAGQALVGLCQADMSEEEFTVGPDLLARTAYRMADAMIAARKAGA